MPSDDGISVSLLAVLIPLQWGYYLFLSPVENTVLKMQLLYPWIEQGQAGWSLELPGTVKGVPAMAGLEWDELWGPSQPNPTQPIPWFCVSMAFPVYLLLDLEVIFTLEHLLML